MSKKSSQSHMLAFYKTFTGVRDRTFDGLVITGRAGGTDGLRKRWTTGRSLLRDHGVASTTQLHSTLQHLLGCPGGAVLSYGIPKRPSLERKLLLRAIPAHGEDPNFILLPAALTKCLQVPHSRHTTVARKTLRPSRAEGFQLPEVGSTPSRPPKGSRYFSWHAEYEPGYPAERNTMRDVASRRQTSSFPRTYFPEDCPDRTARGPVALLRPSCCTPTALNYCVYQTTPYD